MVAHMQAISASTKHPEDSPSGRGPADPLHYAWLLQADMPSCSAKAGMIPGTFDMPPSPEDTSNSWETRAFAEDASGALAAGIWPPRAYPCSFCRREFRSAQALGGHMNVHRRDRARLRHSSPPQSPFCAPTCTPQATSLFQSEKYGVNHSAQSPHESFKRINPSPIPLSMSSIPPTSTPCRSLKANIHNPGNFVTSFPLRLHQLASEAASSLMQLPQPCGSTDLLSLWPTCITNSAKFACHSNVHAPPSRTGSATVVSSPSSNSMVSSARPSPSTSGAAPAANCRRDAPAIGPEDESPKKKSHTGGSLCCSQKSRNSSEIEGPECSVVNIDVEEYTTCSDETRGTRTGGVDLELRLGQRLPQ